jgi:hypothetical protein
MNRQYPKKVLWLIIISAVVKLITASLLELGNDEVYYWTYALQPDWNHFRPPAHGGLDDHGSPLSTFIGSVKYRFG